MDRQDVRSADSKPAAVAGLINPPHYGRRVARVLWNDRIPKEARRTLQHIGGTAHTNTAKLHLCFKTLTPLPYNVHRAPPARFPVPSIRPDIMPHPRFPYVGQDVSATYTFEWHGGRSGPDTRAQGSRESHRVYKPPGFGDERATGGTERECAAVL